MIQQYTFDGSGRQIDAQGVFFRYESAVDGSGVTDLMVSIDGQNMGVFSPGDSLELPKSARRWEVKPVSGGCLGVVKIGNALIKSQKLQGIVQTVDGGRARSQAGVAFVGCGYMPQSAGNFGYQQLFNKAGSGRALLVNAITFAVGVNTGVQLRWGAAALSTVNAAPTAKRGGMPDSVAAELRYQYSSTAGALSTGGIFHWSGAAAGAPQMLKFTEPLVVMPGMGLVAQTGNVNQELAASFEWFEEAI